MKESVVPYSLFLSGFGWLIVVIGGGEC